MMTATVSSSSLAASSARGVKPRARRQQRPVVVNANAMTNTSTGRADDEETPRSDREHRARQPAVMTRRGVISSGSAAMLAAIVSQGSSVSPASATELTDTKMVGAYLPEAPGMPGFASFVAGSTRTPALRAGALEPYAFNLPERWKEAPVSNARSGNYCQPRCDEATTEVQFVDPASGSCQIIIIPTTKLLISKQDPGIDDVGSITGILDAISPAITASVAVEPEEVTKMEEVTVDGKLYYRYELLTPFAESGVHNLAAVSTSKNYVMIATIGASEKQWSNAQNDLRKIIESFRVNVK